MSIIAIKGIPYTWSLTQVEKILSKSIKGSFEALNFKTVKNTLKVCYLQLSEKLDPVRAVQTINSLPMIRAVKLTAFVPDHVPDLPLAKKPKRKIIRRSKRFVELEPLPTEILLITHNELMSEMQFKYPGLYELSRKTNHELIEDIGRVVYDRLKQIQDTNTDATTYFKMTMYYRKRHPHFGDFQFILSTLHKLQDAAGAPRAQLHEHELLPGSVQPYVVDNVPFEQVQSACAKYSDRIVKKVSEHVQKLDTDITEMDTEEASARKKVREELKKISPYISTIVRQLFRKHFIPERHETSRVRIYGEPFLPNKAKMVSVVSRFHVTRVVRSTRMYNMLMLRAQPAQLAGLFAMDGTVISGAKLVIRSVDVPLYKTYKFLQKNMTSFAEDLGPENEEIDDDQYEDWN